MTRDFPLFWNLCLLRASPADVAWSRPLALVVGLAWVITALPIALAAPALDGPRAVQLIALTGGAEVVAIVLLLAIKDYGNRAPQTLLALFGADAVLQAISLPAVLWHGADGPTAFGAIVQLLVFGWGVTVQAHILQAALEASRVQAFLLALALTFGLLALGGLVFPELQSAPPAGAH